MSNYSYDVPMDSNYILVHGDERAYIYNAHGHICIKGKNSYTLCKWILQEIDNQTTISNLITKAPPHLRMTIEQLLKQFIKNNFIYPFQKNLKTSSWFLEQLSNYFSYESETKQPLSGLSKINLAYAVKGTVFDMIPEELSRWPLGHCRPNLNKSYDDLCKLLNEFSENYCLLVVNAQFLYLAIDYGEILISINHLEVDCDLVKHLTKFFQENQRISADNPVESETNAVQILTYDLLTSLFIRIFETSSEEDKCIKILKKRTLELNARRYYLSMRLTPQKILNVAEILNKNVIRTDIPIVENNVDLISELEEINQQIIAVHDPFTGPIIGLDEGIYQQLPLSVSECQLLNTAKLQCAGISARECRNQVVLYALETFSELSGNFGIGWSVYEAMFRAVRRLLHNGLMPLSQCIFKKYELCNTRFSSDSILGYLREIIQKEVSVHELSITFTKLSKCIYICQIKWQDKVIIEPGLSIKQALITGLCNIVQILKQSENNGHFHIALSWDSLTHKRIEKFLHYGFSYYHVFYSGDLFSNKKINKPVLIQLMKIND